MKSSIITFMTLFGFLPAFSQSSLYVDFRYAPDWHATDICIPDDTFKSMVGPQGQLLYDFGGKKFFTYANGVGFKTVIHVLADENIKFKSQKLNSPKVPIVETLATLDGLEIKQETFAYSSDGLSGFGKIENWKQRKFAQCEDIVISHITNNSDEIRRFKPMVIIYSQHHVSVDGSVVAVNGNQRLHPVEQTLRSCHYL